MQDTPPFVIIGDLATGGTWSLEGVDGGETPYKWIVLKLSHAGELYLEAECRVLRDSEPFDERYKRTLTWTVFSGLGELNVAALRAALAPGGELYDRMVAVAAGHGVDQNDHNRRGVLDRDATRAMESLRRHFGETSYATTGHMKHASDWLASSECYGLNADTSDDDLVMIAFFLELDARLERVSLVGALDELRRRREHLQYARDTTRND
ncbi:hypothetical protein [Roseisolibacter sp. H3M3-2]|uniref:hypothetical protein n=1 Tax=Roseisolibacter sp. H3M3-2 TaxID=3031323 RepID=UPI0023DC9B71|nr:hypothetical protein [Roseisolibacter sp. H3M3-2]MDF1501313.1 hypothetical protein [Roseisolibacter sp. H3M3-2]